MKIHLILICTVFMLFTADHLVAESSETSPWTTANSFNRRFDHGRWKTPFVDPDHPPAVELIFLSWNGQRLVVSCKFHNLGTHIVKVEGREIAEKDGTDFYPYATLEVSNNTAEGWIAVGTSPSSLEGRELVIFVAPNPPNQPGTGYRGPFDINLDAFRPHVGKYEFGRVVLKDGNSSSQVIVLTDLLPPEE